MMDNLDAEYEQTLAGSVEEREREREEERETQAQEEATRKKNKKKRFKMMCFSCNREEYHSLKAKRRWLYSYVLGASFGLSYFVGPFPCSCCGSSRLMCRNWMSLRYWFRKRKTALASSKR